jgi:DNA segregation ATPase FtsK/SpoIIIE-like protein
MEENELNGVPTFTVNVPDNQTLEKALGLELDKADWIVVDGTLEGITTNWPKNRMLMSLSATKEQAEYEAERLGEIARLEHPCTVKIHEINSSLLAALELPVSIESVRTDHKNAKVTISFSTGSSEENVSKALTLGFWSLRGTAVTVRFSSRQMGFKFNPAEAVKDDETPGEDRLLIDAIEIARMEPNVTVSLLQRRMRIGYTRAARLRDILLAKGIISDGSKDGDDE